MGDKRKDVSGFAVFMKRGIRAIIDDDKTKDIERRECLRIVDGAGKDMICRPNEHRDDALNRLISDPLADKIKALLGKGVTVAEITDQLRVGLWHGMCEYQIGRGENELDAEQLTHQMANRIIPREE